MFLLALAKVGQPRNLPEGTYPWPPFLEALPPPHLSERSRLLLCKRDHDVSTRLWEYPVLYHPLAVKSNLLLKQQKAVCDKEAAHFL